MKTIICFLFLTFLTHSNSCDKKGIIKFCLKTNIKGFKNCVIEQENECKKPTLQPTENTPTTAKPFQQTSFEQNEDMFELNEDTFEQYEDTFEQNEDTFEQNEEPSIEQRSLEKTTIFNAIPADGPCKKIDLDYTRISKVCVERKLLKFCLNHYPKEFKVCMKSVQINKCYKNCFVNITTCFYQIPIKKDSEYTLHLTQKATTFSHANLEMNLSLNTKSDRRIQFISTILIIWISF